MFCTLQAKTMTAMMLLVIAPSAPVFAELSGAGAAESATPQRVELQLAQSTPSVQFAQSKPGQREHAQYSGAKVCAGCHQQQYHDWQSSHHQLAMQKATAGSVKGDFNQAIFTHNGLTTTFYRQQSRFWVKTDNAEGDLQDFEILYTLGVEPLQQYLIAFPDGRLQALAIAWDNRTMTQGGQRWFHLYPETEGHEDILHWTRQANNWNTRCAECHSTRLEKNYHSATNSFQSNWSEINVACEACHGPGQQHVLWANRSDRESVSQSGLIRGLSSAGQWQRQKTQRTAVNMAVDKAGGDTQIDSCAGCHSRRNMLRYPIGGHGLTGKEEGLSLLNKLQLRFLESPLYYVDGQIRDEVYVHGSFLQSKMHQQGVVCTDCHNPHSLKLKAPANQLCSQCHNADYYDQTSHHHHSSGSAGAECVNCHMPETTYMQVDPRRDHSLRIPRPDLSLSLEVPNACSRCHSDQSVNWAADQFAQWYPQRNKQPHFGEVFQAAMKGSPQGLPRLTELINNPSYPQLTRASGLLLLRNYTNRYSLNSAIVQLKSSEPLIRLAAVQVMEQVALEQRADILFPLLQDPEKAIRLEASRLLAGYRDKRNRTKLSAQQQADLSKGIDEYRASLDLMADEPSGQMQIGLLHLAEGYPKRALAAYQQALLLEPDFVPAMINMADIYRQLGDEAQGLALLERALEVEKNYPAANFSLGLLYVRLNKLDNALPVLKQAATNAPDIAHYSYVYGVALYEAGKPEKAVAQLEKALQSHPGHQQIRAALVKYLQALGRYNQAQAINKQLTQ